MTLGEKIKKYRELRGLTQRALGQRVGFSIRNTGFPYKKI